MCEYIGGGGEGGKGYFFGPSRIDLSPLPLPLLLPLTVVLLKNGYVESRRGGRRRKGGARWPSKSFFFLREGGRNAYYRRTFSGGCRSFV